MLSDEDMTARAGLEGCAAQFPCERQKPSKFFPPNEYSPATGGRL